MYYRQALPQNHRLRPHTHLRVPRGQRPPMPVVAELIYVSAIRLKPRYCCISGKACEILQVISDHGDLRCACCGEGEKAGWIEMDG